MLKFFFRTGLFALGSWFDYHFGQDFIKPIQYKLTGEQTIGRIEGFMAGSGQGSVQPENTGVRNGKRKARRPVFRYSINATDSVSSRNGNGVLFTFFQYELNEKVQVVFSKNNPNRWLYF